MPEPQSKSHERCFFARRGELHLQIHIGFFSENIELSAEAGQIGRCSMATKLCALVAHSAATFVQLYEFANSSLLWRLAPGGLWLGSAHSPGRCDKHACL